MINTNKAIVENLRQGNKNSLHLLYDQYCEVLLAFAKHTIRNPLLAEDFVQDAFCTLWENRSTLKDDQPVQSYLFELVHRRCVDFIRKQQAQSNYANSSQWKLREMELIQKPFENLIISEIFAEEAQSIIRKTIDALPGQTREIFLLSRDMSLKNSEIADKKGISVKAIEYHISKALSELREALKDFL